MKSTPWWIVALIVAIAAVILLGLAILLPSPWGWIFVVTFVVVFICVLRRYPAYFYRNSFTAITSAWLVITTAAGFSASLGLNDGTFAKLAIETAGPTFTVCVTIIAVILLFLDFLQINLTAGDLLNALKEVRKQPSDAVAIITSVRQSERGKIAQQYMQQTSKYFAVDPADLTRQDRASVALQQMEEDTKRYRIGQRYNTAKLLGIAIIFAFAVTKMVPNSGNAPAAVPAAVPAVNDRPVTIHFKSDEVFIREKLDVEIVFGTNSLDAVVTDGRATIRVPASVNSIDSIVSSNERFEIEPKGPFPITPDKAIECNVIEVQEAPPADPPPDSVIFDLPSVDTVNAEIPKIEPKEVVLWYKNATDRKLKLFLYDCTPIDGQRKGFRYDIPLEPMTSFEPWKRFSKGSSGWFGFAVRDEATQEDYHIECRPIFRNKENYLTIMGEPGAFSIELK